MIDRSNLKHISFDLWLTLIKSNPLFKPLRNDLLIECFGIDHPPALVSERVNQCDRFLNIINEQVGRNVHTYEILLIVLERLDVNIQEVSVEQLEHYYLRMEELFFRYHPVLIATETSHILAGLQSKGITLNILSNTGFIQGRTLRKLLAQLDIGQCFSFQLYSDEMGYSKPSAQAYHCLLESLSHQTSINKEAILHIGDNRIADYEGAIKFGIQAQLINSNGISLGNLFGY
ncbi:MAG: HAD family hydrolase [Bacteroidota bacterium]